MNPNAAAHTSFRLPSSPFSRSLIHDPLSPSAARFRINAAAHTNTKPVLEPAKPIKPFRYRPAFMSK